MNPVHYKRVEGACKDVLGAMHTPHIVKDLGSILDDIIYEVAVVTEDAGVHLAPRDLLEIRSARKFSVMLGAFCSNHIQAALSRVDVATKRRWRDVINTYALPACDHPPGAVSRDASSPVWFDPRTWRCVPERKDPPHTQYYRLARFHYALISQEDVAKKLSAFNAACAVISASRLECSSSDPAGVGQANNPHP